MSHKWEVISHIAIVRIRKVLRDGIICLAL